MPRGRKPASTKARADRARRTTGAMGNSTKKRPSAKEPVNPSEGKLSFLVDLVVASKYLPDYYEALSGRRVFDDIFAFINTRRPEPMYLIHLTGWTLIFTNIRWAAGTLRLPLSFAAGRSVDPRPTVAQLHRPRGSVSNGCVGPT
jgi:hypothetical protein